MAKQRRRPARRRDRKGGLTSARRKPCPYCRDKVDQVDYKDISALRRFISERGKIRSRRITGACRRHQSQVARAVKRARELALLPYVAEGVEGSEREVLDGALVIFGGALLLTPGFITDVFGLLFLLPPTRVLVRRLLIRRAAPRVMRVAQPPSPKATLALLRGVEDVLDVPLPLADLPEEARAWERGVDELAQQDSEVADYVRTLEEAKDAMDLPEASGDAIAREFERYFRRHGGAGESAGPGGI